MDNKKKNESLEILEEKECLVNIATTKIKDFIFSTNKMKLIRGASYLLDYLNQVEIPNILQKNEINNETGNKIKEILEDNDKDFLNKLDEIIDKENSKVIYIGAGNAKFFVKNKEVAEKICNEIKEKYKEITPGIKIIAEYEEIGKEKIWDVIDKLEQKMTETKNKGFSMLNIDLPFMKKCDISNNEPAVISCENLEEDLKKWSKEEIKNIKDVICKEKNYKISQESAVKIKYSNKIIKDDKNETGFYSIIKREIKDIYLGGEISSYSDKNNFIGFVYTDGDGLGDFLRSIKNKFIKDQDEIGYLKFLKKFSTVLDRNTKISLKEVLKDFYDKGKFNKKLEEETVIGEFLIVGGDDVCAVFQADLALEISAEFQKKFEEKMKKFAKMQNDEENNITSSGGVIIAKDKTPIYQLFERAIELQKIAKLRRYENSKKVQSEKTGYIDFQVIGSEGVVNIKEYRKKEIEGRNITERPYSINDNVEGASPNINKLIKKIKSLKNVEFPNTKLKYIYDLKKNEIKTDNEKIMEMVNIFSKMSRENIEVLNNEWQIKENLKISLEIDKTEGILDKVFSDIFDILEMYNFINVEESK
ncbi:MAG: hypothetical protein Q4D53_08530, partial [Leptotrichiaceae bacterium]|nr:hypothetical protein [Leptotrichiaceae bacterium]